MNMLDTVFTKDEVVSAFKMISAKSMIDTTTLDPWGLKYPDQMNNFIKKAKENPTIFQHSKVIQLTNKETEWAKIDMQDDILYPTAEGSQQPTTTYADAEVDEVVLKTSKFHANSRITYETLEDSINGQQFKTLIEEMFSEAIMRSFAIKIWQGDTASANAQLTAFDGLIKLITTNVVDAANNTITKDYLFSMVKKLPDEYKGNPFQSRFLFKPGVIEDFSKTLENRETNMGDLSIEKGYRGTYMDYPLFHSPYIGTRSLAPDDILSDGILTLKNNIIIGIQRGFELKLIDEPLADRFVLHTSGRIGIAIQEEKACVKIENVKHDK